VICQVALSRFALDKVSERNFKGADTLGTEIFNLHKHTAQYPHVPLPPDLRMRICIENAEPISGSDLRQFGGLCIDLSHLEEARLRSEPTFSKVCRLMDEFPVLANHLSAITKTAHGQSHHCGQSVADHRLKDESEIDYVTFYPPKFFGRYCALELMNPIAEQLTLIPRITDLLHGPRQREKQVA
jgi:hypothetical protein